MIDRYTIYDYYFFVLGYSDYEIQNIMRSITVPNDCSNGESSDS